jgi:hypothetical protein
MSTNHRRTASLSEPICVARSRTHRAKISLDGTALSLHNGLIDLQVGEGLRLDREPVGEAVALGLPSFVVRGAELGDRRRAQGDDPN